MGPQSVKNILQDVLSRDELSEKMEECKALLLWNDVASNLASRTEPTAIRQGRMLVRVTDSVILHQLTFYKKKFIRKINVLMGKRVVKDIIFRVGRIEKNKEVENRDDYIKRLNSMQLDQEELERINQTVAEIDDEEIQDSLRQLFTSQSKLSKIRSADNKKPIDS